MDRYIYLNKRISETDFEFDIVDAEDEEQAWDKIEQGILKTEVGFLLSVANFKSLCEQFKQRMICTHCNREVANPGDRLCPRCEDIMYEAQIIQYEEAQKLNDC